MSNGKFENSVRLDRDACKGCTNCIKRCPTGAIRVRDGKAVITKEYCIDCGQCIRVCPHHAKIATYDPVEHMKNYEYTVALPAPSLYGQFNNLDDTNIVLTALRKMGFDAVHEVGAAAEIISHISRDYVDAHPEQWPLISTACPSVVKLIRVRFPNLIPQLLPLEAPVELAATMARRKAMDIMIRSPARNSRQTRLTGSPDLSPARPRRRGGVPRVRPRRADTDADACQA